jgi:hypothetical protein
LHLKIKKREKKKRKALAIPLWSMNLLSNTAALSQRGRESIAKSRARVTFRCYLEPQFLWRTEMADTQFYSYPVSSWIFKKGVSQDS